jgi:mono/diheme cytochrome c family protein
MEVAVMLSKKHRLFFHVCLALIGLMFTSFAVVAEPLQTDSSRGKLLYSLHCIACHNEQVHWLANKKASDWPSLIAQVKLWQNISNLKWSEKDVDNVARYLNNVYYHYPTPNTVAGKK